MLANNEENISKLIRKLKSPVFRFILVKTIAVSYYAEHIKTRLEEELPNRKSVLISPENKDYRQFMDIVYSYAEGIVLIEDFDELIDNPDLAIGFNQRRDKMAELNIAIVGFVPDSESIQKLMSAMPDLWSFRSVIVELSYQPERNDGLQSFTYQNLSSNFIDKETAQENLISLNKRLEKLAIIDENLDLINSTYFRLLDSYESLGKYQEGLEKAIELNEIAQKFNYEESEPEIYVRIVNRQAEFNYYLCNYIDSMNLSHESIRINRDKIGVENLDLANSYINLAGLYFQSHEINTAKQYNEKALRIWTKTLPSDHPNIKVVKDWQNLINLAIEKKQANSQL